MVILTLSEKESKILKKFHNIEQQLSDPNITSDIKKLETLSKERTDLIYTSTIIKNKKNLIKQLEEVKQQISCETNTDLKEMLIEEESHLTKNLEENEQKLKVAIIPKNPDSGKNIYLEVRAGTGGEEAALFSKNIFRMYLKYFEKVNIIHEIISMTETGLDGIKEVIMLVKGSMVYDLLHKEAGVHRVQRVPSTESQGRVHTSACTVAIIPEEPESEISINPFELRIDVYRSSGPGGQSVNTTDSAVRITHIPTNIVVSCQDEKSQHKNKAKALKILQIRLTEKHKEEQHNKMAQEKKVQVGSGDRSQRIRTYNYPQNRITDHRINITLYSLDKVMEGNIQELLDAMQEYIVKEKMNNSDV